MDEPEVNHTTIRMLLSLYAVSIQMCVKHLSFTHCKKASHVWKLENGLYGSKQAARIRKEKLNKMLNQQGYIQGEADQCLYTRHRDGKWTYLLVHVDDLFATKEIRTIKTLCTT